MSLRGSRNWVIPPTLSENPRATSVEALRNGKCLKLHLRLNLSQKEAPSPDATVNHALRSVQSNRLHYDGEGEVLCWTKSSGVITEMGLVVKSVGLRVTMTSA